MACTASRWTATLAASCSRTRTCASRRTRAEFAINMSNQRHWEAPMQRYIERTAGRQGRPTRQGFQHALGRLDGGRRAPHHLTRGGIFIYPLDAKIKAKGGKLRLMYEANPMAFIVEQAGGVATDRPRAHHGNRSRTGLHQRVPVFLGSKNESRARHSLSPRRSALNLASSASAKFRATTSRDRTCVCARSDERTAVRLSDFAISMAFPPLPVLS